MPFVCFNAFSCLYFLYLLICLLFPLPFQLVVPANCPQCEHRMVTIETQIETEKCFQNPPNNSKTKKGDVEHCSHYTHQL